MPFKFHQAFIVCIYELYNSICCKFDNAIMYLIMLDNNY